MYLHGDGVAKDVVQAYKWCNLAANSGSKEGEYWRNVVARELTAAQLKAAIRLSQAFVPKKESAKSLNPEK